MTVFNLAKNDCSGYFTHTKDRANSSGRARDGQQFRKSENLDFGPSITGTPLTEIANPSSTRQELRSRAEDQKWRQQGWRSAQEQEWRQLTKHKLNNSIDKILSL